MARIRLAEWASARVLQFLKEEEDPSELAHMLNLVYKGWGKWGDETGQTVAKTVKGRLVKLTPEEQAAENDKESQSNSHAGEPEPHPELQVGKNFPRLDISNSFEKFINNNGGAKSSLSKVIVAVKAARNSNDDAEKWKALRVAKEFKKSIPGLANRALKMAHDAGARSEKYPNAFLDFDTFMDEKLDDEGLNTVSFGQSPETYPSYDWGNDIDPYDWAELYDWGNELKTFNQDDVNEDEEVAEEYYSILFNVDEKIDELIANIMTNSSNED
jgi:hypothetical protein